jgi:imidazolonepropionase-like amidohydrolase
VAAGTRVVRQRIARSRLRDEIAKRLAIGTEIVIRSAVALAGLVLAACGGLARGPQGTTAPPAAEGTEDASDALPGSDRAASRPSVVIRGVTVVDVVAGRLLPDRTVTVAGDRIASVTRSTSSPLPPGARVVDGAGGFLIPGLWDMHGHALWSEEAMRTFLPLYVAHGVTGVRDMGGRLPVLASYRAAVDGDDPPWPRVIAAGEVLDGPEPVQADISIPVPDAASAAEAVRHLARSGADFVKVYTLLSREAWLATIAEADRLGLVVAGHVPGDVSPEEAARAGQRSIEHLRDEIEPFCARDAAEECARLARVFREERTWQVPTLVALRAKSHFDDPALATDARLRYLPADLREEWLAWQRARTERGPDHAASKRARFADELWLTGFLAREGVPLLAGTDAGVAFCHPGSGLHDELELLVEAGLTPLDALRAATLGPAGYLDARATMGSIEVGRLADLVLLRRNPLVDVGATREIEGVVLRGRLLERRDLDRLLDEVAALAENE